MAEFLTAAERDKFASYLEQDAKNCVSLAEQMEKLSAQDPKTMGLLAKRYRAEAMAAQVVAKKLRSIEEDVVANDNKT